MLNQVNLIGHLGKDPEVRYLPSGDCVCNFSLATTEKWKDKQSGEQKEQTEWHNISVFGKLAEICGEYLKKGSKAYIGGSIRTRKYTDKNDGIERHSTFIKADAMRMLDSGQQHAPQHRQPAQQQAPAATNDFDDDIPF